MTYSLWRNGIRLADIVERGGSGPPSLICGEVTLASDFADYEALMQLPAVDRPERPIVHGITHTLIDSTENDVETMEVRPDGAVVWKQSGRLIEQPVVTHVPEASELFEVHDASGAVVPVDLINLNVWRLPDSFPSPNPVGTKRWIIMIARAGSIPFPDQSGGT